MKKYIHYSKKPLQFEKLKSHPIHTGMGKSEIKPVGLWISVEGNGDGWLNWCQAEDFHLDYLKYENIITFHKDINILMIDNAAKFMEFHNYWDTESKHIFNPTKSSFFSGLYAINWAQVKRKYQGIIIAPYMWEFRMGSDTFWYYGWDCASGCIWDISIIKSINSKIRKKHIKEIL